MDMRPQCTLCLNSKSLSSECFIMYISFRPLISFFKCFYIQVCFVSKFRTEYNKCAFLIGLNYLALIVWRSVHMNEL